MTNFRINNTTNQYQGPQQNNFGDIFINQSPTYFNQYRYEDQNQAPYIRQVHYYQRQKLSADNNHDENNLPKNMKNVGQKDGYFFNDFKNMKESVEREKNLIQRSVNTFINKSPNILHENYYNIENNKNNNILKSLNEKQMMIFKRNYDHQSYQGEKYSPNYYRNNPFININIEKGDNSPNPVAQKICNIIIKGETKNDNEKLRSEKKKRKLFGKNILMEENDFQGTPIPNKNINFNLNSKKNYISKLNDGKIISNKDENNVENDNEEIEEKEEDMTITNSEDKREYYSSNKKNTITEKEIEREDNNEEYEEEDMRNNKIRGNIEEYQELYGENEEEYEQEEDGEPNEIPEQDPEMEETQSRVKQVELLDEEDGEENRDERLNEIENENEEENNGINKRDIEELEEEEIQQVEIQDSNNIRDKKNNDLQFQKENEIELNAIRNNKPLIQIQKVESIQSNNNILRQKKNNNIFNITKDDKVEIIGGKKPLVLEMNNESNIEFIKEGHEPIIQIQKVQSLEQPRSIQKKDKNYILNISKNMENNVDIIYKGESGNEPIIEMQKVQNFQQPRDINKKIENKNNVFNISKLKEANFILKKNVEEPELKIEKSENFEEISNKNKQHLKKNKNTQFKIIKLEDNNVEIIGIPTISICNESNIEIKKEYNSKKIKNSNYKKYKISKRTSYQYKAIQTIKDVISTIKDSRFAIRGKPKKVPKKVRNIIRREITYFYKSPISQKKAELSIGGKFKNIITPTTINIDNYNSELRNQPKNVNTNSNIINNRKVSSNSLSNASIRVNLNSHHNSYINAETKKSDIKEEKKEEKKKFRTYKTTTIFSSNLINPPSQQVKQEFSSIRRKYTDSKSNKNVDLASPQLQGQSSNHSSKEKVLKTESSTRNGRNHIMNIISPPKDTEKNKNDNNNFIGRNNKVFGTTKYEHYNKNILLKTDKNNNGKTQSYFGFRNNNNKTDILRTPISKDNANNNSNNTNNVYNSNSNKTNSHNNNYNYNNIFNNYKNKSHTITIFPTERETKNVGRTYITSSKLNQRFESSNTDNKNFSNVGQVFISNTHNTNNNNQTENRKTISNTSNTFYISTNLKKDDKKEDKNESKDLPLNNNVYYSSSFTNKKNEPKQFFNNNQVYISSNTTNKIKNISNNIEDKNELKANINKIMINSSSNSPINNEKLESKPQPKNMNKIFNNENSLINNDKNNNNITSEKTINKESNDNINNNENMNDNKNSTEEEIINTNKTEKEIINTKKTENEIETKKDEDNKKTTSNIINNDKKEEKNNNNPYDIYNINMNSEISEITKSYLNSCMPTIRPELSDFSKQFLNSSLTNNYINKPELSNITRAYLISQSPEDGKDEDK